MSPMDSHLMKVSCVEVSMKVLLNFGCLVPQELFTFPNAANSNL
ncbi:hypothetical protein LINPERPRIM_LOCUS11669, partial [Linum perenne]